VAEENSANLLFTTRRCISPKLRSMSYIDRPLAKGERIPVTVTKKQMARCIEKMSGAGDDAYFDSGDRSYIDRLRRRLCRAHGGNSSAHDVFPYLGIENEVAAEEHSSRQLQPRSQPFFQGKLTLLIE
jgi:hypothetical protein